MGAAEVLFIFYCRNSETESLALAAAVGSVQSRATIRLRRLRDSTEPGADCAADLARMRREYVAPAEADILRANAIVFAAPPDFQAGAAEWSECLGMLQTLGAAGKLKGKVAAVLAKDATVRKTLADIANQAGLRTISEENNPAHMGRRIAAECRDSV
jgi:hypothetical protein